MASQFESEHIVADESEHIVADKVDEYLLNPELSTEFCFTIEGNIGCGKSTFLELLRERLPEAKWIEEPVNEWQNLGGKNINILERYYK